MQKFVNYLKNLSPTKIILAGYCIIILLGAVLLRLPIAVKDGATPSFLTSFFTATSATCVTGLIRADTFTNWSYFGQGTILVLIQIGGIGFMTICISALTVAKRNIGLAQRSLMQNSISAPQLGGIVKMTKFIVFGTLIIEVFGALLLAFYFCPAFGVGKGIWYSVFHSISAFCNAGFDLMGVRAECSSLTSVASNWYVNLIICTLIVVGGLGFFVWKNIIDSKFRFKRMNLHTKIVIVVSILLIIGGAFVLFGFCYSSDAYYGMSLSEKVLASIFQSVSARTAGFNTVDLAKLTDVGKFLMICLMLVGGSPGSTAGGMKTTTLAVLVLSVVTTFRHRKSTEAFGRRFEEGLTRTAACIFMLYIFLACSSAVIISHIEAVSFIDALFETISAVATVGLTVGITSSLSTFSCLLLCFLMLFGRVGSITMLLAFSSNRNKKISSLPLEKIQIG